MDLNMINQIKKLWKDVFRDSDDYIELVVENSLKNDIIEYEERDGKVVAIMFGKIYSFGGVARRNSKDESPGLQTGNTLESTTLQGVYLSGLATHPDYRNQGIMSRLMERMEERCRKAGYAFTFLIPANEGLIRYYRDRGYVNAFKRVVSRYLSGHNFAKEVVDRDAIDGMEVVRIADLSTLSANQAGKLCRYITAKEAASPFMTIRHSEGDLITVFKENSLSGGNIWFALKNEEIAGVILTNKNENNEISIPKILSDSRDVAFYLLDAIGEFYGDNSINIYHSVSDHEGQIFSPYFFGENSLVTTQNRTGKLSPINNYGMIKILNYQSFLNIIFLLYQIKNLKLEININSENKLISVSNGCLQEPDLSLNTKYSVTKITGEELSEILWRNPLPEREDPFILPRIKGNIFWMLD